jgi:hypothetical protein
LLSLGEPTGAQTTNIIAAFGAAPALRIDGANYSVANKTALVVDVAGTKYRIIRNSGTGALETEAA